MNRRWAVPRRLSRPCQGNTRSIEQGRFPRSPRCLAATKRNREQAGQGKPHQPKRDGPRQNKLRNFRSTCHETRPTITLNRYPRLGHHRASRSPLTFCPLRSKAPSRSPGPQIPKERLWALRSPCTRVRVWCSRRGHGALADPQAFHSLETLDNRAGATSRQHLWPALTNKQ